MFGGSSFGSTTPGGSGYSPLTELIYLIIRTFTVYITRLKTYTKYITQKLERDVNI